RSRAGSGLSTRQRRTLARRNPGRRCSTPRDYRDSGTMGSVRLALCVLACLAAAAVPAWGASSPKLQIVANDLTNPRKIFIGHDGAVYVVEAGSGSNVGT